MSSILWRLLTDLAIPHATLLDLDLGRRGGGWGRIKNVCKQLLVIGTEPRLIFRDELDANGPDVNVSAFDQLPPDRARLEGWVRHLRTLGVFFCSPLDLDFAMLSAFRSDYQKIPTDASGPSMKGDPWIAIFEDAGIARGLYADTTDELLHWYRYLFLGRGKPSTHVRVLTGVSPESLAMGTPEEIRELLKHAASRVKDQLACAAG